MCGQSDVGMKGYEQVVEHEIKRVWVEWPAWVVSIFTYAVSVFLGTFVAYLVFIEEQNLFKAFVAGELTGVCVCLLIMVYILHDEDLTYHKEVVEHRITWKPVKAKRKKR